MKGMDKYDISFLGEFVDKALEREFFCYYMNHYSRLMGPVALIFGTIYMLFIIDDYLTIESHSSFIIILFIRILFLMVSVIIYFCVRRIKDYSNLAYLITAYEILAVISFMVIIYQYGSIGYIAFFSV